MSEALVDEIEAINSIFGDETLAREQDDPSVFVLTLPGDTASLRLRFPPEYPDVPPAVLGTHSAGSAGKRGAAARHLALFRDAVGEVYEPGQVCLFDAIEKSKSTFVARCAPVTSPSQAADFLAHLLATDKRVRTATHNITAWRIRGPNGTSFQDCDDDGETAAGGRLLHLMQLMDLWDTMVVVTRWYGGQKLGPRRFALINQTARDAFVRAGLVKEEGAAGGAGGKKKGGK
ncbi:ribosomal protein S5 domain 2-type protein [Thermothelomyces heterothallicus CBS 202.75]|uniref:ribosomal protein S5 domain 2-type protein n=1 Tax=Thermothelomyces heterothallicus CBS 202.75 TaxID=1149848 RepID=UPI0037436905